VAAVPAAHPRADPARVAISLRGHPACVVISLRAQEFARGRLRAREGNRWRDQGARA
jgi:hypothetical protein